MNVINIEDSVSILFEKYSDSSNDFMIVNKPVSPSILADGMCLTPLLLILADLYFEQNKIDENFQSFFYYKYIYKKNSLTGVAVFGEMKSKYSNEVFYIVFNDMIEKLSKFFKDVHCKELNKKNNLNEYIFKIRKCLYRNEIINDNKLTKEDYSLIRTISLEFIPFLKDGISCETIKEIKSKKRYQTIRLVE